MATGEIKLSEVAVECTDPVDADRFWIGTGMSATPATEWISYANLLGPMLLQTVGGRLTTETGVPVSTSDRTAQATIYFTPAGFGNRMMLYNSSSWRPFAVTGLSLALSGLTSGKNYDVFVDYNDGTPALALSAAWTNDTTRADALALQDGAYVKSGDATLRYVGTIRTTGTTTTEDSAAKRFVWNLYNQVPRQMQVLEGTDTWAYTTGTWRQANGAAANQIEFVIGLAQTVEANIVAAVSIDETTGSARIAVGVDSVTTPSGLRGFAFNNGTAINNQTLYAMYRAPIALGYHYLAWLEFGATNGGSGTCTFTGDGGSATGSQTGITGVLLN